MKPQDAPFLIGLDVNGQETWLTPDMFSLASADEVSARYYREEGGCRIEIEITHRREGKELLSRLQLAHAGEGMVKTVKYPCQRLYASTFDELLISSAWGDAIQQPAKTIRDVSTSPSIRFEQDYIRYEPNEIIYTYPAIMAMQYMVLHNKAQSRYFATYSQADETMTFHAKTVGKYEVELSVNHYPFTKDGSWTSPECGQARLGGGWHEAARLYRSHMADVFPAPDYPAWMREDYHGWAEITMKREKQRPEFMFSDVPGVYEKLRDMTGVEHMFLVGWHGDGHDTKFPDYRPTEAAGTPQELRAALDGIRELGGRCSLYTNARLIDTGEAFYKDGGKNATSRDANGKEYLECYGTSSVFAVSCPGCDEYVDAMRNTVQRICGEYGADGMFADQISCNLDPFCYATGHPHKKPSTNFLPGVERELRAMRDAHKAINPVFHTFAEGCHERFNSLYDVNQGHGEEYTWQIGKSVPEQFLYTFPDRIVTGHCADKQQMYHAMAQFKPLDIKTSCYNDESNHAPLKRYMALRRAHPEYFLRGKFIDDEGFTCDQDTKVFAVRGQDGSICFSAWKKGAVEDTPSTAFVRLPDGYRPRAALHPAKTGMRQDGDWLELEWTGPVCYIVLDAIK